MTSPETMAQDWVKNLKASHDDLGLWGIAHCVSEWLNIKNPEENKKISLQIVRTLMANSIMPGDLGGKSGGFDFWQGAPDELYTRVEASWPEGRIPNLSDPCWFAYRSL